MDLRTLPLYVPRTFVPADAALTDPVVITTLYEKLLDRPVVSTGEFEAWLLDRSELDAALGQAGSILYIEMTCATDDPAKAKAYQDFIEHVEPAIKPLAHKLSQRFLSLHEMYPLDPRR